VPPPARSSALPAQRFARAAGLIAEDRQAAIDSLMLLRVELLDLSSGVAGTLGDVIASLRQGRDVGPALARARSVLAGPVRSDSTLGSWDGAW
jgi:hypothetical protein